MSNTPKAWLLFDHEDVEPIAILTKEIPLQEAVKRHFIAKGLWNSEVFDNGEESLTGEQYCERPDYVRDGFSLTAVDLWTT